MPADHHGDAFVACRGSWNSTRPVGYCVARVLFDEGKPYGQLTIVSTIERTGGGRGPAVVHARPVDCVQAPDGSVLFSADQPGRIYRIRAVGEK
jgi:glucose/arabinose dehydrogenase